MRHSMTSLLRTSFQSVFSACAVLALASASASFAQTGFVNFESPQSHPIDVTPDGSALLVVNTADGQLEVFDLIGGLPVHRGAVAVGVDPVSVRARSNSEVWVVNQISDSLSVIDLASMRVTRTVQVGDEPADIVFTVKPARAFVSLVASSKLVSFDPSLAAPVFTSTTILGAQPRALAVSPSGTLVYAAIFESGNKTTVIPRTTVNSVAGPYAGVNPPPNSGATFNPPRTVGQPNPPRVAHIARKNAANQWMDDNNRNWTTQITWGVVDNDIAVVNATTLSTTYVTGLMSCVASVGVSPNGTILAVGIEASNEIRFEPVIDAKFAKMFGAFVQSGGTGTPSITDLNPHLTYTASSIPELERYQSIGDPRGVAWLPDGSAAFVAALGSNCVIAISPSGARIAKIGVGEGPSGVVASTNGAFVYVLNRFDSSVSTISVTSLAETARVGFHDATPTLVKNGRKFIFDTNLTSGLGHTSCATCHIDARSDRLGWDLGDPTGVVEVFDETCQVPGCISWHPMKGVMTTQTLFGIIGNEPFHWRGEKDDITEFNVAFTHLQGRSSEITPAEMASMTDYLASLTSPPNPNRNLDNSLKTSLPIFGGVVTGLGGTGNPTAGQTIFNTAQIFGAPPGLTCLNCHAGIAGTNNIVDIPAPGGEAQNRKNAPLRDVWRKVGANRASTTALRGFGFDHNGEEATLQDLLSVGFAFPGGATGAQQRRDVEAFCLSFGTETRAGVGAQTTATGVANDTARINSFVTLATAGQVALIVKGAQNGAQRGWVFQSGSFRSDRANEPLLSPAQLLALAAFGNELTYTLVPAGTQTRVGIDRDGDTYFDSDELLAGSDPADAKSIPGVCLADIAPTQHDGVVNAQDLAALLSQWGSGGFADLNGDGTTDAADMAMLLSAWGNCS
ncbi:MAG: hypothetical protein EXS10_09775 [Phycisphaerales bacterium]|nr:hypothetical protein [Phycisphaerales bacterium]